MKQDELSQYPKQAKNVTTIRAIPAVQPQKRNMESKQESVVTFNCGFGGSKHSRKVAIYN